MITKDIKGKAIQATPHRVVATANEVTRPRVAVPLFLDPPWELPVLNLNDGKLIYRDGLEYLFNHNFDYDSSLGANEAERRYQAFKANYYKKKDKQQTLALSA